MKPRKRKCKAKGCNNTFLPFNSIQQWCSPACGYSISKQKTDYQARKEKAAQKRLEKVERAKQKKRKQELKPLSWFHNKARIACHAYIRYRDRNDKCISCDKILAFEESYDAGHWKTRGAHRYLAYDEVNINGQCSRCNTYMSGNEGAQRPRLVAKWGEEEVLRLESSSKDLNKKSFTRESLLEIEALYKRKLKELRE